MVKKTTEQIKYNMKQIKNKDSKIELLLRKELWQRGIRYRKNVRQIVGKPDIAFMSKKIAVFCDSEFWHGYNWEEHKNDFNSNQAFWEPKIERNIQRDKEVNRSLAEQGWMVLRFWGKAISEDVKNCADIIEKAIKEKNK